MSLAVPPRVGHALCRGYGSGIAFAVGDGSYRTVYHEITPSQPGDAIKRFGRVMTLERYAGDVAALRAPGPPAATVRHATSVRMRPGDQLWCPVWTGSAFAVSTLRTTAVHGARFTARVTSAVGPCRGDSGTPVLHGGIVVGIITAGDGPCATVVTIETLPF
jgi:hypothetical protein